MGTSGWTQAFVVLPGTGSDAAFAHAAFSVAAAEAGADIVAVEPNPERVVGGYLDALSAACDNFDHIVVCGISIGAAVGLGWARAHPRKVTGVIAALPAWTGDPRDAPAAISARFTASRLRAFGLQDSIASMTASSPPWLAENLSRSWSAQWPHLPAAFDEAAAYHAPTEADLRSTSAAVSVVAAIDDPIHPRRVAEQWHDLLPTSVLTTLSLGEIGRDPESLGALGVTGLRTLLRGS